ncbi:hypothetical protein AWQ24_05455 [Picosynechococcus sp. PCC 8807]|nr:hypothetical protein AWQ24_05455 [Picosynechococcus sp. PCC 8807]
MVMLHIFLILEHKRKIIKKNFFITTLLLRVTYIKLSKILLNLNLLNYQVTFQIDSNNQPINFFLKRETLISKTMNIKMQNLYIHVLYGASLLNGKTLTMTTFRCLMN